MNTDEMEPPRMRRDDAALTLKVGDECVIRRTSGAEQVATVKQILPDMFYKAPEVVSFEVTFMIGEKRAYKWCTANDLIRP